MSVKPIPAGYHTITPHLVVNDAAAAIDYYKRAFGAREISRMDTPMGKIGHAELEIGDSRIMMADEWPGAGVKSPQSLGGTPVAIHLYVDDVDSVYQRAVAAGGQQEMPPTDMFWGDRYGKLKDPFGHSWGIATHKEDVAPEEMKRRMQEEMAKMAGRTSKATQ
jgi:PhnB protein